MCGPTITQVASTAKEEPTAKLRHMHVYKDQPSTVLQTASFSTTTTATASSKRRRSSRTVAGLKLLEFHGILGMISLATSVLVVIVWSDNDAGNFVITGLVLVSVFASTILSIHSSIKMLDHAPVQTVIFDLQKYGKVKSVDTTSHSAASSLQSLLINLLQTLHHHGLLPSPFCKIVAPHREAFHRTSLILQYINARILWKLLNGWNAEVGSDTTNITTTNVMTWALVVITCIRMIPNPTLLDYRNGNTFCFVFPMVLSVVGDCAMTLYVEWGRRSDNLDTNASCRWLSLRELTVVQLTGLVIAFLFTLAFRSNKKRKAPASFLNISIRPLYCVTAAGMYGLVGVGIWKAQSSIASCSS